jgi:putative ABC transport system permease protein
MLSGKFLQLIGIALLVAFPIAWFIMNRWLENVAYQVEMEWWMFAIAAVVTICIAMATVSYESIKAALMNPVKSLRSE